MKNEGKGRYTVILRRARNRSEESGSHGGAWKIAYSDFVTTLMAFFMLLWLLNSTPSPKLKVLSEYFKSAKIGIFNFQKISRDEDEESMEHSGSDEGCDLISGGGEAGGEASQKDSFMFGKRRGESEHASFNINLIKKDLNSIISNDPAISGVQDNISIEDTEDGVVFSIKDDSGDIIFDVGTAVLSAKGAKLLEKITPTIQRSNRMISIRGYSGRSRVDNSGMSSIQWELASDRAHAARKALEAAGVESSIFTSMSAYSSSLPGASNEMNSNKRLEIVILNNTSKRAENKKRFGGKKR